MNHAQVSRIPLSIDVVDCIVFWTKDPINMLNKISTLDEMGYRYYFQFTLTPYGVDIEHNLRDKSEIIKTFTQLSKKIGKERIIWRYDPIVLNHTLTIGYHIEIFEIMCKQLCEYTDICTISFVDIYSKFDKAIKDKLIKEITQSEMIQLAAGFSEIGNKYKIELRTCAEIIDLLDHGIRPASCIDKRTIERICGYAIDVKADTNQRKNCGCLKSIDIGAYNTCRNGCVYCYANYSDASIKKNSSKHSPYSDILIGAVGADQNVIG